MKAEIVSSAHMKSFMSVRTLKRQIKLAARALKLHDFDTIAFRGMSGAFLGVSVAQAMNKEMILVRKPADDTHSEYRVEGNRFARRYVIVDDFTSSGRTVNIIVDEVREFAHGSTCVGMLEVSCIDPATLTHSELNAIPYPLR